jgi:anti-sigma B factor antagonist
MNIRKVSENVSVIDISGDLTAASEDAITSAYSDAATAETTVVVLNFSGVQYMNSAGIGGLVTLVVRANREGRRLVACGLSDHYRRLFELTRLDEAMDVHGSEEEALQAAGTEPG